LVKTALQCTEHVKQFGFSNVSLQKLLAIDLWFSNSHIKIQVTIKSMTLSSTGIMDANWWCQRPETGDVT